MLTRLARDEDPNLLTRFHSVIFLSSPAQGAHIAQAAAPLSPNPQLLNMAPAHDNAFLQELEDTWRSLIVARDRMHSRFPRVHYAYETLPTYGTMVVPREMAASHSDSDPYPMPFDHRGMATPTSRDADPYAWTMARISEVGDLEQAVAQIETRLRGIEAFVLAGQFDEARRAGNEVMTLARRLGEFRAIVSALTELGDVELAASRVDECREHYTEAIALARSHAGSIMRVTAKEIEA